MLAQAQNPAAIGNDLAEQDYQQMSDEHKEQFLRLKDTTAQIRQELQTVVQQTDDQQASIDMQQRLAHLADQIKKNKQY